MRTILKSSKAKLIAFLAVMVCMVMAISLTACNNNSPEEEKDPVITKYSATLEASITMIPTEPPVSFGSLLADTYVTEDNGAYTLTLIFAVGEVEVASVRGNIFIDDNPNNPETIQGVKDGTIGAYNLNGQLVTEGVKVTYSSDDDYLRNKDGENVYYVKSAALPVDSLRESYEITFYANSAIMGKQFSNDTYSAKVKLNLSSGAVVEEISGLGVDTLGSVPPYTSYDATLDASINMGIPVSFGDVLKSAYITAENGELTLTLIFTVADIEIREVPATIFVDDNPSNGGTTSDIKNGTIGIYNSNDELVTEGVKLTYGKGYAPTANGYTGYVQSAEFPIEKISDSYTIALYINSDSRMGGSEFVEAVVNLDSESGKVVDSISGLGNEKALEAPDVVNSMSFTVSGDTLENTYNLAVYVTAFNTTAISGMQFPYESAKLGTTNAVLTITEEDDDTYSATLDAEVNMGGSSVNFTENLIKGIEIEDIEGGFKITIYFGFGTVNMPYNNVMTGYMNGASNTDYFNNVVDPIYGYYDGDTLVTEGVELN